MPCFHPIKAFQPCPDHARKTGVKTIVFSPAKAINHMPIQISCGQCVGCRLERSRQWAIRCMHEAQMHYDNCFITLTFSPEALEKRNNVWSLDVRDWQLFMKKLRKKYGPGIRFFHCGEYGEKNKRPHYHACIFGFDFPDKQLWKITDTGYRLYISPSLTELWPYGFSTIGTVTFESAAYVARYIMKKITGPMAENYYDWFDGNTGEIFSLKPEYTTMSRRPGIGRTWLDRYIDDIYPHDFVVVKGVKMRPPKYYDGVLKSERPYEFDDLKSFRVENSKKYIDNNTPDRLRSRELVQKARLALLPRSEV